MVTANSILHSAASPLMLWMARNRLPMTSRSPGVVLSRAISRSMAGARSLNDSMNSCSASWSIVAPANELVRAQNELKTKEVEVQTAKKEAERIAALNANSGAIGYMNAMANLKIAEGVAEGKVHTIVVPYDFKGIVNAK